MYEFNIRKPKTIAEAVEAMGGEVVQALSGGQTLIPTLKQRLANPSTLVSLTKIQDMVGIELQGRELLVRGATTHAEVASSSAYPALAKLASHIGDPAVRNRGTIGGSLANNDPAACYPAAVLASLAKISTNERVIESDDFFQGLFETALNDAEIITEVKFSVPEQASYQKFVQPASRFALVGVFVAKYYDCVRVAVTGAWNNGVFRWREAEDALHRDFSANAIDGLTIRPDELISDLHADAAYRAHLIKVMTGRAVVEAA